MDTSAPNLKHRRSEETSSGTVSEPLDSSACHSSKKIRTEAYSNYLETGSRERPNGPNAKLAEEAGSSSDSNHILHPHAPMQTKAEQYEQEKHFEHQRTLSGEPTRVRMAHSGTPLSGSDDSDESEHKEPKYFVSGRTISSYEQEGLRANGQAPSESESSQGDDFKDWIFTVPSDPESLAGYVDYVRLYGFAKFASVFENVHPAAFLKAFGCPVTDEFVSSWKSLELLPVVHYVISQKLERKLSTTVKTLEDVVSCMKSARNIMVISGAGISVSCGIPDFRSEGGIYSQVVQYGIQEPTDMFDLAFFRKNPVPFYMFAKEIWPENFQPSPSHLFIKALEEQRKLLRDYTQNIDHIESRAGISKVLQCHGSFASAACTFCRHKVPGSAIRDAVLSNQIPRCTECKTSDEKNGLGGVLKPDIIFFGESLPNDFDDFFLEDREAVDLVLVMGSSLKVAPVSELIKKLKPDIPQVLINREHLIHLENHFDVQLLGFCDDIVAELCYQCGWELKHDSIVGKSTLSKEFASSRAERLRGVREVEQVVLYRIPQDDVPPEGSETGQASESQLAPRRVYQDPPFLKESDPAPLYYYLPVGDNKKPLVGQDVSGSTRKMYFFKGAKYRGLEIGPEGASAGRLLRTSNKTGPEDTVSDDLECSEAEDEDFVPYGSSSSNSSSQSDSDSSSSSSSDSNSSTMSN